MTSAPRAEDSRMSGALELLFEQQFAARLPVLKTVRASVLAAARSCGFGAPDAQDIVLAVDEACKNVIVHGYRGDDAGEIALAVFRCEGGMMLHLRDFAPLVDPALIVPRDLADVQPGKLGTHFIRSIMDCAELEPAPDGPGNLLRLAKWLE
jgi:sigma-B regulation protein RsbU (phosphoserine phosphatase)